MSLTSSNCKPFHGVGTYVPQTICEHIVYVPMQTVPITIDVVGSNLDQPDQGEVYNIM